MATTFALNFVPSHLVKKYRLTIQIDDEWKWYADIEATSYQVAFRQAGLCIPPEHYDKPIRLETVEPTPDPQDDAV